jgi:hypothetical protein
LFTRSIPRAGLPEFSDSWRRKRPLASTATACPFSESGFHGFGKEDEVEGVLLGDIELKIAFNDQFRRELGEIYKTNVVLVTSRIHRIRWGTEMSKEQVSIRIP